ncbi:MAG TPA: glycogen synthase GlgA [Verrucomicrobiae bacterium]|nr:glycogen synthase GlgA [Verrucomicrobiae bacterium]
MKILMASSEVHPYSKTGGLGDMVAGLAKTLARLGHQVGIVTPLYRGIRSRHAQLRKLDWRLALELGPRTVTGEIWIEEPVPGLTLYFVQQPQFFDRHGIYSESGSDYADNADRFVFLSKAAVHLARYLPWQPEVVHAHDWQTGLIPILAQHEQRTRGWDARPPVMLTIHNLAYQGTFAAGAFQLTNLPWSQFTIQTAEFYGAMNCLKCGIACADVITTVSPRYAREITTEEFGCGLDGLLRERIGVLHGVINGVDYDDWNTAQNPFLPAHYSAANWRGKEANKAALLAELGLVKTAGVPLFGSITRLAEQKGIDLLVPALDEMLAREPMQFVMLGSGDPGYERAMHQLEKRHPGRVAIRIGYDPGLAHRIEAGCDFYLMPSRFEPCGLNQLYSLRYGTVPVVRAVGGLDDTVVDAQENAAAATGIKFCEYSPAALAQAIRKALALYAAPAALQRFRQNGMVADFSWDRTAERYVGLYGRH